MLLEGWKAFELEHGDEETRKKVEEKMPKRMKKRRKIETADGVSFFSFKYLNFEEGRDVTQNSHNCDFYLQSEAGWEEYYDYIFPEDESARPNLKLLAMAKMWKKKREDEVGPEEITTEDD